MIVGQEIDIFNELKDGEYLRIEGISVKDEPMVVINPIYNNLKKPVLEKWFEIKDRVWKE